MKSGSQRLIYQEPQAERYTVVHSGVDRRGGNQNKLVTINLSDNNTLSYLSLIAWTRIWFEFVMTLHICVPFFQSSVSWLYCTKKKILEGNGAYLNF